MQTEPTLQQRLERISLDWAEIVRAERRARFQRSQAFHALARQAWIWLRRPVARATAPADCGPAGACA